MSDQQGWTAPGPVPPAGNGPPDRPWTGYGPGHRPLPPPPPPPRLEYRPGIIPLRPLMLGEIWSGVFATVRGNPGATLGLALVTTAAVLVPATALALWLAGQDLGLATIFESGSLADPDLASDPFLNATVASYIPALAMWIASILLPVFMALVIGHAVQGQKVTLAQTWQQSRGRILTAIATTFLVIAMFIALVVALIIVLMVVWATDSTGLAAGGTAVAIVGAVTGGIYLWVKVGFAVSIVVLEGAGARRSIARSWQLTRGRPFWRIFGIRLLTSIVATIAGSIVATPIGLIALFAAGSPDSTLIWLLPLSQAVSVLVQGVLVTPFVSGVDSLLYVDQRIRREGLDVMLMQQLHPSPSP